MQKTMLAAVYHGLGDLRLEERPVPVLKEPGDAIVKVTLSTICTSDLHILNGAVPRAVPGTVLGHEFVGEIVSVGESVKKRKVGERVAANCITFCGDCWFCRKGFINNCTHGGWELGCRIDGCQAEYVRVPYADNGLTPIPNNVSDEQALFVGDILATGYWAAKISEISEEDTVLIIGAGPTGLCTLECVHLYQPHKIVVCEADKSRRHFVRQHYPNVKVLEPTKCLEVLKSLTEDRGADRVIEVAGGEDTFELAWRCARPNAIVTIVALYEKEQILPLPWMYGKNLTFKTGGVDACDCDKIMQLISEGKIDTTHLITHRFPLSRIQEAYTLFANRADNVIKTAISPD